MSAEPQLHVEVEGGGPVVVLAHGFGGSARNFLSQARALRDRYRIVRFDARGHARSEAPAEASAYTPDAFVADLGRVLDQVGARAAVVGGLSMGAGTALRFALAHPERVQGLVLAAFPPGAGAPGTFAAVAAEFADAIEREGLEAAGARFVWRASSGLHPAAARLVRRGFLEHPPHGLEEAAARSEEHTSELQSQSNLVCRLLLEKKKNTQHERRQPQNTSTTPGSGHQHVDRKPEKTSRL